MSYFSDQFKLCCGHTSSPQQWLQLQYFIAHGGDGINLAGDKMHLSEDRWKHIRLSPGLTERFQISFGTKYWNSKKKKYYSVIIITVYTSRKTTWNLQEQRELTSDAVDEELSRFKNRAVGNAKTLLGSEQDLKKLQKRKLLCCLRAFTTLTRAFRWKPHEYKKFKGAVQLFTGLRTFSLI